MRARRLSAGAALASLAGAALLFGQAGLIEAKARLAPVLLERAFARTLEGEANAKPWPWADMTAIARLSAPDAGRSWIVVSEAGGEALAFSPAHMAATPAPGERGVSVIAAHRDTHFAGLGALQPGDAVEVTRADGTIARFTMTGSQIVRHDASGIHPHDGGAPRLALVTCWPFDAVTPGPWRYVAWFEAATAPR